MAVIRSLYLHIPFCERKCEYCDFVSVAGSRGSERYVDALCGEIAMLAERTCDVELGTVFIGGGTPSLVAPPEIGRILETVRRHFAVDADAEISMEANPSSISAERAAVWRAAGVNRVSVGVQSLHEPSLRFLGRVHDATRALDALGELRTAGVDGISCDLIYAVPGLDGTAWLRTLRGVIAANPDHISCYELTVEPGTPLHTRVRRGLTTPVADEIALEQHAMAVSELAKHGYTQYEVSNFAKPDHRCRHNLAYWHNDHYLAAGVGAHGHVPAALAPRLGMAPPDGAVSVRYWHGRGIAAYADAVAAGALPVAGWEAIDAPTGEIERLLTGLRLTDGVAVPRTADVGELTAAGLLEMHAGRTRVTRRGEAVLNSVVERLAADGAQVPCYS